MASTGVQTSARRSEPAPPQLPGRSSRRSSSSSEAEQQAQLSSSDSGTVDDFEEGRRAEPTRAQHRRSRSRSGSGSRKPSQDTFTKRSSSSGRGGQLQLPEQEQLLLQHRNEVRRLRQRIQGLEEQLRAQGAELSALRERTRFQPARNPDPNAEANLLRRDNERQRREIANLNKNTLKLQADLAEAEKKVRRSAHSMVSGWGGGRGPGIGQDQPRSGTRRAGWLQDIVSHPPESFSTWKKPGGLRSPPRKNQAGFVPHPRITEDIVLSPQPCQSAAWLSGRGT